MVMVMIETLWQIKTCLESIYITFWQEPHAQSSHHMSPHFFRCDIVVFALRGGSSDKHRHIDTRWPPIRRLRRLNVCFCQRSNATRCTYAALAKKKMEKHHLTLESVCSSFRLEATPRRLISIRQNQKCPKVNRKSAGWPG